MLTFFAAIRLGVIAVPMYPPEPFTGLATYRARSTRLLNAAGATVAIASAKAAGPLLSLQHAVPTLRAIVPVEDLREPVDDVATFPPVGPDDVAFLQFTSGSTTEPRGVTVTHSCLVANAAAIVGPSGLRGDPRRDIGVTWLPLYHDMGLVGFVLVAMCTGIRSSSSPLRGSCATRSCGWRRCTVIAPRSRTRRTSRTRSRPGWPRRSACGDGTSRA